MTTIAVKPHPDLDPAAAPLLVHPVSGGLLDAAGKVPADGRPWLNDGFTCRMLTDGAVLRADDPVFSLEPMTGFEAAPQSSAEASKAAESADPLPKASAVEAPAAN